MAAKTEFPGIVSLSIDTWGVDYVLLRGDEEIRPVYAYRDSRTEAMIPKVHEILPFSELYAKTGCQFQPFNSIYQLYADKLTGRLDGATDFLMIPEYLLWKLCGVKVKEYTNATTTGMVNAITGEFDTETVSVLALPALLFPKLHTPGTVLGEYDGIKCVLCATHDTASAVEGIPMEGNHPYISSGTWSLLGVKTPRPHYGRCQPHRQLLQRGRRGLQPLPEKHHGHVAREPVEGRALPRNAIFGDRPNGGEKPICRNRKRQCAGISRTGQYESCL